MNHYIERCRECKNIISQCRCMSCDKELRWSLCANCKDKDIPYGFPIAHCMEVSYDELFTILIGKCWHKNEISPCSIGEVRFPCSKCGSSDYNVNYASNPLQVLKEMINICKSRGNIQDFLDKLTDDSLSGPCLGHIPIDYLLDTSGGLRDKAIEFLRYRK